MLAFFNILNYNNKAFNRNAEVVEWQTRRTQNPLVVIPCGFKSHLRHQAKLTQRRVSFFYLQLRKERAEQRLLFRPLTLFIQKFFKA